MNGKGDKPRPRQTSREEYDLRWALATGHLTFEQFSQKYHDLKKQGKIIRGGKVVH